MEAGGTETLLKCRAMKLQKQKLSWSRNNQRTLRARKKASTSTLAAKGRLSKRSACPLLNGAGNLVTKDIGKAKILNAFLCPGFCWQTWLSGLPVHESTNRVCGSEALSTVDEGS